MKINKQLSWIGMTIFKLNWNDTFQKMTQLWQYFYNLWANPTETPTPLKINNEQITLKTLK